jgi:hypothetical protein
MTDCPIRPLRKIFRPNCSSACLVGATSNKIVIGGHGNDLGSFSREEHSLDGSVGGLLGRGINHTKAFVVSAFLNGTNPFASIENNGQSTTLGIMNGLEKMKETFAGRLPVTRKKITQFLNSMNRIISVDDEMNLRFQSWGGY